MPKNASNESHQHQSETAMTDSFMAVEKIESTPPTLLIGTNNNSVTDTILSPSKTTWEVLKDKFKNPDIGNKDGSYFTRCPGTIRNNQNTDDTASILILDGDSSLNNDGDPTPGAPHPRRVSVILRKLGITHCIYSSYSNGCNKANEDPGYDPDFHRYRVIIPCDYTREQLPVLLENVTRELHNSGVMLANVKENKSWSQPWYFPRVPDLKAKELFKFYSYEGQPLDANQIYGKCYQTLPDNEPDVIVRSSYTLLEGQVDVIDDFNKQNTCEDILLRNAYTKSGDRFLRPGSETGAAAVQNCQNCKDGVERVFSHGNDILSDGKAHDAFDCYLKLECNSDIQTALNWNPELTENNRAIYIDAQNQPEKVPSIDPALIYQQEQDEQIESPQSVDTFPTEMLRDIHEYCKTISTKSTHLTAMVGVIALASVLSNRIFRSGHNNMTVLYLVVIAISGKGKNNVKEILHTLLIEAGLSILLGAGKFTGSSALRNLLVKYPARIMVIDEFGDKLSTAQNKQNGNEADGFSSLKDLYSDCNGIYLKQAMADSGRQPKNAEKDIIKPCLSMVGISTPNQFNDALDKRSLEGGFINRLTIVDASQDQVINNLGKTQLPPEWLTSHLKQFYDLRNQGDLGHGTGTITFEDIANEAFKDEPDLTEIPFSNSASERIYELNNFVTEKSGDDELIANLTVRWLEQAMRMALALTMLDNPEAKEINVDMLNWCWEFVSYHGDKFIKAHREQPQNQFEKDCNEILKAIRKACPQGLTKKQLGQNKRFKSLGWKQRDDIIKVLVDDDLIRAVEGESSKKGGPKPVTYYAIALDS
jgi:hypothetical protein